MYCTYFSQCVTCFFFFFLINVIFQRGEKFSFDASLIYQKKFSVMVCVFGVLSIKFFLFQGFKNFLTYFFFQKYQNFSFYAQVYNAFHVNFSIRYGLKVKIISPSSLMRYNITCYHFLAEFPWQPSQNQLSYISISGLSILIDLHGLCVQSFTSAILYWFLQLYTKL